MEPGALQGFADGEAGPPAPEPSPRRRRFTAIRTQSLEGDEHLQEHKQERAKTAETRELIVAGIRQNRFCKMLEAENLHAIAESMEYFAFKPGNKIVQQGDPGNYFFVVHEGVCEVIVNGAAANTLGPGISFGAIALLYKCPRTATVAAQGPCGVWGAQGDIFRRIMRESSQKQHAENRRFLDSMRLFDGLSPHQKERVGELALLVEVFEDGARVVSEGEAPNAVYFVKRGAVRLLRGAAMDAAGRVVGGEELTQLRPGDSIGERGVLYNEPHGSMAVSDGQSELVCISIPQLKEVLGEDILACLEASFLRSILRKLPVVCHLSLAHHQRIVQAMKIKNFEPGAKIDSGLRLLIVLGGEVLNGQGGAEALRRGQWCQDTDLLRLEGESSAGCCSGLESLSAGGAGCRLAVLGREDLAHALQDLGLATISVGEESVIEYMRKTLLARKVPVFHQLSDEQIDSLVNSLVLRKYQKGAQVFRRGEVGSAFYVVASGEVSVMVAPVRILGQGTCFGERALLLDDPRSATVEVTSDGGAELWSLDRSTFRQVVTETMREELVQRIRLQDTSFGLKSLKHVRLIGRGSFGSVRLVEHTTTRQRYALKRICKKNGVIPDEVWRECAILAEVDHPFMLRMVRSFETAKSLYILMELITGGQLCEEITERMGLLSRKHAQFYIGCLVLILEAVHQRNIVYRDLKPENVMLDARGYLKLVDFGLAKKLTEAEVRTYTVVGTPLYIAPEVLSGQGYGVEVDIWATGVMLYELVTGALPFGTGMDDETDVLASVLNDPLTFPPRYNDSAGKKLIQGMLCRQPAERLGAGINGWEDIKEAKFFKVGVTGNLFTKIAGREVVPPVIPATEQYSNEKSLMERVDLSDADELCPDDPVRERTHKVFQKFDVDGDGRITRDELASILQTLDPKTFTNDAIDKLLSAADLNRDGHIVFEEFLDWVSSDDGENVRRAIVLDIHN